MSCNLVKKILALIRFKAESFTQAGQMFEFITVPSQQLETAFGQNHVD